MRKTVMYFWGMLYLLAVSSQIQGTDGMDDNADGKPNRLIHAESPYLQQHAYNPVDWYEWGDEPFLRAKEEDKPVFLSIGYSSCHWCHVMEEESFSDPEIGKLLNDSFISIKVDREQRPDIDAVYMMAAEIISGTSGWPLNLVLTPQGTVFFAATYIPKESIPGRTGLTDLLPRITQVWQENREDLEGTGDQIRDILNQYTGVSGKIDGEGTADDVMDIALQAMENDFDPQFGGFGTTQKFTDVPRLMILLDLYKEQNNREIMNILMKSMDSFLSGGIYDHVGNGIHRYTVDRTWTVPHFEKMLYDQAMLLEILAGIYPLIEDPETRFTLAYAAENTVSFLLNEMSGGGLFFSALDAGGTDNEGLFYTWTLEDLKTVLDSDYSFMEENFTITEQGNFQGPHGIPGLNVLQWKAPISELAAEKDQTSEQFLDNWNRIREILAAERTGREKPFRDEKILSDWNALTITALARSSIVFEKPEWLESAEKAMNTLLKRMSPQQGNLLHMSAGRYKVHGFLDDYAFVTEALLELHQASAKPEYLDIAFLYASEMIDRFWDKEQGGFYRDTEGGDPRLVRIKRFDDNVYPSGANSAFLTLVRLSKLSGSAELIKYADLYNDAVSTLLNSYPQYYPQALRGILQNNESVEIVIFGNTATEGYREMRDIISKWDVPGKITAYVDPERGTPEYLEYASGFTLLDNRTTVYVCRNKVCNLPVNTPEDLIGLIEKSDNRKTF